ncbi:MAG TPA: AraC family transcriptional regulator [Chitinophagaceae bacterium]
MHYSPDIISRVEEIHCLIMQNPARRFYVAELARQASLPVEILNNAFRLHYGLTIPQCIVQAKMSRAVDMLLDHHPIKEIAAELGYKHVVSFHKAFRKTMGLTATQYYLQHRQPRKP